MRLASPRPDILSAMKEATLDLFSMVEVPHPDGWTYDPSKDHARLSKQLEKVKAIMLDGEWHTLKELADKVNGSEAGVSARARDLRKKKFGGYTIERQRVTGGLWKYRLVP